MPVGIARDLLLDVVHPPVLVVRELAEPLLERGLQCRLVGLVGSALFLGAHAHVDQGRLRSPTRWA